VDELFDQLLAAVIVAAGTAATIVATPASATVTAAAIAAAASAAGTAVAPTLGSRRSGLDGRFGGRGVRGALIGFVSHN
jgi:hypothetical protein